MSLPGYAEPGGNPPPKERTRYPEHDKLKEIQAESQIIGEFLDTCGYTLCQLQSEPYLSNYDEFIPVGGGISDILARYFSIDQNKIEAEKRAMLEEMRTANA